MISAQECRDIQGYEKRKIKISRLERLDKLIRERASDKYLFCFLPLNGTGLGRLKPAEKKYLEVKGFHIWEGQGGKCGAFDIIGW